MFGVGGAELVLIVLVLLIFVGPDKLPSVARTVGTGLRDLRRAANLATAELREGMDELSRDVGDIQRDVHDAIEGSARPAAPSQPLAEVPRRAAPSATSSASPDATEDAPAPAQESRDEAAAAPAPRFNRPGSAPLAGTVARSGGVVAAAGAAADHAPVPAEAHTAAEPPATREAEPAA